MHTHIYPTPSSRAEADGKLVVAENREVYRCREFMGSNEELEGLLQNALCRTNNTPPIGVELAVRMYANVVDVVVRKTGSQIIAAVVSLRETVEQVPMNMWTEQVCQERDQAQVCGFMELVSGIPS